MSYTIVFINSVVPLSILTNWCIFAVLDFFIFWVTLYFIMYLRFYSSYSTWTQYNKCLLCVSWKVSRKCTLHPGVVNFEHIASLQLSRMQSFRLPYRSVLLIVSILVQFTNNCDAILPAYTAHSVRIPCFAKKKGEWSTEHKRIYILGSLQPIQHLPLKNGTSPAKNCQIRSCQM